MMKISSALTRSLAIFAVLLILPSTAMADVRMPAIFSDHMVLQADAKAPIWGWAKSGEKVRVEIAGQSASAEADSNGKWQVQLKGLKSGGPYDLKIEGSNQITIQDVLIGEVWLASGQSNMAMKVSGCKDFDTEKAAANHPKIRMFTVTRDPADKAKDNCKGGWKVCSPETVGDFSGTAYYFGRALQQKLNVPVGLINSSVGGTPIEAWTSWSAQEQEPALADMLATHRKANESYDAEADRKRYERQREAWQKKAKEAREKGQRAPRAPEAVAAPALRQNYPSSLYNGMIAPLAPYAIKGAIWYQGEANSSTTTRGSLYATQLALLAKNWRSVWNQGDFALLWVQLPNFTAKDKSPAADADASGRSFVSVREGMLQCLKTVPNSGMAITIDIGEANDIHPKNKQDVGKRLAAWALAQTYKQSDVGSGSGPLYESHQIKDQEVLLTFDHADDGLKIMDGQDQLAGFVIAGEDKVWKAAKAKIVGKNQISVSHPDVAHPQAVRYAWSNNPDISLTNSAGLPASPFRTDSWPLARPAKSTK